MGRSGGAIDLGALTGFGEPGNTADAGVLAPAFSRMYVSHFFRKSLLGSSRVFEKYS